MANENFLTVTFTSVNFSRVEEVEDHGNIDFAMGICMSADGILTNFTALVVTILPMAASSKEISFTVSNRVSSSGNYQAEILTFCDSRIINLLDRAFDGMRNGPRRGCWRFATLTAARTSRKELGLPML